MPHRLAREREAWFVDSWINPCGTWVSAVPECLCTHSTGTETRILPYEIMDSVRPKNRRTEQWRVWGNGRRYPCESGCPGCQIPARRSPAETMHCECPSFDHALLELDAVDQPCSLNDPESTRQPIGRFGGDPGTAATCREALVSRKAKHLGQRGSTVVVRQLGDRRSYPSGSIPQS
jgi:hypothetical protein